MVDGTYVKAPGDTQFVLEQLATGPVVYCSIKVFTQCSALPKLVHPAASGVYTGGMDAVRVNRTPRASPWQSQQITNTQCRRLPFV